MAFTEKLPAWAHMNRPTLTGKVRIAIAVTCIAVVATAFIRGNHLMGSGAALAYAFVAAASCWLAVRLCLKDAQSLVGRGLVITICAIPLGILSISPGMFSTGVQHVIEGHATYRDSRQELQKTLTSDPAFAGLSENVEHFKVHLIQVTISGTLADHSDFDRLCRRIVAECPTVQRCLLFWDIRLLNSGERITEFDDDLFSSLAGRGEH